MWKPQVALRKFLGDPWPTMVLHPTGTSAEDRMTLIEAINEATRLGSGFGKTRSQEAQREILEQALISATTSAEALSAIVRRANKEAGGANSEEQHLHSHAHIRRHPHDKRRRKPRLEWLDLMTPAKANESSGLPEEIHLTSVEKRLLARYRNQHSLDSADFQRQPSVPTEISASRNLSASMDAAVEFGFQYAGDLEHPVILEGGSYVIPFEPNEPSQQYAASKSPSASAPPPGWVLSNAKKLGATGIQHAIKDADESIMQPLHMRPPQPLTHASLFATIKQFREQQQQQQRVEDEEFAHF